MSAPSLPSPKRNFLIPGTLNQRIQEQTQYALDCGALQSIATDYQWLEEEGIEFLVRIVSNLNRKDEAKKKQEAKEKSSGKMFNPFLPYEGDLFVADLSETHLCLLNKFNVVDHHLLIITRAFEDQEHWLTQEDFFALETCLQELDGLAFYNGGKSAGASQKHKHLQLIPLPFFPNDKNLPIEEVVSTATFQDDVGIISQFKFSHALGKLTSYDSQSIWECYHRLIQSVGLPYSLRDCHQSGAYNLLATRKWMLLIPRSQESFESIAINALGYAGALLVRTPQQFQILKKYKPLRILTECSYPDVEVTA